MKIPLSKPSVGEEEKQAVLTVLDSGWLGLGPTVKRFETEVARFVGAKFCIAVNSGTVALQLALEAVDVKNLEVIVPSLTFAATIQAVLAAGGIPVFADCSGDSLNMDPQDVRIKISPRTRAIVPVHYAGDPADMSGILQISKEHSLVVVEDAAHTFGSEYKGKKIGGFGDLTCFSFDPIKTLTCIEGGAVCTQNKDWAERIKLKRELGINHNSWERRLGNETRYSVLEKGYRASMSEVNAAVGLAQLDKIPILTGNRRKKAKIYDSAFLANDFISPVNRSTEGQVPFCYTVRITGHERDKLMEFLRAKGVETAILYPPNHLQPAFREYKRKLPATESNAGKIVSIPLFPDLGDSEINYVIESILSFLK